MPQKLTTAPASVRSAMKRPSSASAAIGCWVRCASTATSASRQGREEGDLLAGLDGRVVLHELLVDRGEHAAAGGEDLEVGILDEPAAERGNGAAVSRDVYLA